MMNGDDHTEEPKLHHVEARIGIHTDALSAAQSDSAAPPETLSNVVSNSASPIDWQAVLDEEKERQEGFRRIGEFIFWFSQLEFTIKARLERALCLPDKLGEAVTTPYDFAVLCTVTQTVLLSQYPADNRPEIEQVFKDCRKLNDEKVRIVHGMWSHAIRTGLIARYASRTKLKGEYFYENPEALPKLATEAQRLMQGVLRVPSQPK
jgi:hypothetical protein